MIEPFLGPFGLSKREVKVDQPHRILVVDDTVVYRRILTDIIAGLKDAEVVGSAPNGVIALKKIPTVNPDVVLLDVEMPEMDGLETLKIIKRDYPEISVIMISGVSSTSADLTIKALANGALDFIKKPEGDKFDENVALLSKQIAALLQMHRARRYTRAARAIRTGPVAEIPVERPPAPPPPRLVKPAAEMYPAPPGRFDLLAIGSSTGGPEALTHIIPKLPANLNVPVLLVQHMPPMFTASMAKNLDRLSALRVKEAEDGELIKPNVVYVAPGGFHMVIRPAEGGEKGYQIVINDLPPVKSCRPSVDVLFRSIAEVHGRGVLSVVLTGMGDDGADGVLALKRQGTYCLAQSEKTCVVYGMPRAVDEANLSNERVDLDDIADRLLFKLGRTPLKES